MDDNQKDQKIEETSDTSDEEVKSEENNTVIPGSSLKNGESQNSESRDPSATPQDDNEKKSEDKTAEQPEEATEPKNEEPATPAQPAKDENPNAKWYVVHTYSGHENKVALTLKQKIDTEHLENKILDVLVPMQEKIEIKGGKKVNIKEKIFPGYILVKMVLDDISWLAVRTTQGVTSFVGMGNKPTPISDAEVQTIVKFTQSEAPMYKQVFMANDTVKIVDGPFADFIGKIDSVDEERGKVKVLVSIFGRETPVELDFLQIKKI